MENGARAGTGKAASGVFSKLAIVLTLAAAVGVVLYAKSKPGEAIAAKMSRDADTENSEKEVAGLPRLVDLGADKCIPCKMMAPILEDLKIEYAEKMDVQFIDVWKNPAPGKEYGIRVIPTQIFFDASGKELFRHEGFISKEDILANRPVDARQER